MNVKMTPGLATERLTAPVLDTSTAMLDCTSGMAGAVTCEMSMCAMACVQWV